MSWQNMHTYYLSHQSTLSAGALSGALHALTGPDHIAALLPLSFNKRLIKSGALGSVWGLGHGMASVFAGLIGSGLKGFLFSDSCWGQLQKWGDLLVALSILVIGATGLWETQGSSSHGTVDDLELAVVGDGSVTVGVPVDDIASKNSDWASSSFFLASIFVNGFCLGLSVDGLPSLAPVLPLDHSMSIKFLSAYFLATVLSVATFGAVLGESSHWISRAVDLNISTHLARLSSWLSCGIGCCLFLAAIYQLLSPVSMRIVSSPADNDNVIIDGQTSTTSVLRFLAIIVVLVVMVVAVLQELQLTVPFWPSIFRSRKRDSELL
jgi:hypothetical protein